MKINEWLDNLKKQGLLCGEYTSKIENAKSKARLMDIVLDANGVNFLQEMDAKGCPFPYESILRDFKGYINGRYVGRYYNKSQKSGYTSTLYCCFDESDIYVDTTLVSILGCTADIWIGRNDFVKIYADKNCKLMIHCNESSRCIVEYWDGAIIEVDPYDGGKVELIKR